MKKIISTMLVIATVLCLVLTASCSGAEKAKVKLIDIKLTEEEYAFGVDKNQPELLSKVNAFIAEIKANGKMDGLFNNYFGNGTPKLIESKTLDTSKDQLVVATNAEFAPFEYTQGNYYTGIDMELAAMLAEYLGLELVIQHMEFNAVCLSVGEGKCDIAMAGLTVDEKRKESVVFSDTYYLASQKLIVLESNTAFDGCKTKEDVEAVLKTFDKSKKAGAQNSTTGQAYIEGDAENGYAGFGAAFVGYTNGSLAVQDMINGKIDIVVIDEAPAAAIVKAMNKN